MADRLLDLAAGGVRLLPSLTRQPGAASLVCSWSPVRLRAARAIEEVREGESPADFAHKGRLALKEVRETRTWLTLTVRAWLVHSPKAIAPLLDEADQLVAILTASANTARRRADHST